MLITSLENEKVKNYKKLMNRKYREKTGMFLVEGMHLVLEAYKAGILEELILEQDEVVPLDVETVYVTNEIIHKLSEVETPSKIMGLCKKKESSTSLGNRVLLLDGIQDPGNLGTIIRSSKAFHVDTIILGKNTVDLYNPKVIRATQGMMFHMNMIEGDLEEKIKELKNENYPIYGTRVLYGTDARSLSDEDCKKYALIVGNEGNGVRREVLDLCDSYLYINMCSDVESLNVAVATSILLYELDRNKQE